MKKIFLILGFSFLILNCSGQTFQKVIGLSANYEQAWCLNETSNGYIIAGVMAGLGYQKTYVVNLDSNSNIIWARRYGGILYNYGTAYSVRQTNDNGFIVGGWSNGDSTHGEDFYLNKLDFAGNVIWSKTIGGPNHDDAFCILQTNDNGYAMIGQTESFGAGDHDVYLVKTDSMGNLLWSKTYGGTGWDVGYSGLQTSDGGYLITGNTMSFGATLGALYLIRTDNAGNLLWSKKTGSGMNYANGRFICSTADGGYILTGETDIYGAGSWDVYLIKMDSSATITWAKTFGGAFSDYTSAVRPTSDGGYIVTASTQSFGAGYWDVYLLKTDSMGNLLWSKTFGESGSDQGVSALEAKDGGYLVCGWTENFSPDLDIYLIKTNAAGNSGCNESNPPTITTIAVPVPASCATIVTTPLTNEVNATAFSPSEGAATYICTVGLNELTQKNNCHFIISPTPITSQATITFSKEVHNATFSLYNLLGEKVAEVSGINGESFVFNRGNLRSGVYIFEVIETEGKSIWRGKAVVY